MRTLRILGALSLALVVGNCGGGDSGPEAGWLRLTLNTPNVGDGAILFRVQGGEIDSVAGGAMMEDGSYNITASFTRIVVSGSLVDGPVAYVHVPDVGEVSSYAAIVEQVANNTPPHAQRSLTGYSIAVAVDE